MPSHLTSKLTNDDLYLFNEGTHFQLYDKLGAHLSSVNGRQGTHFAVWAPEAEQVSVVGTFNDSQNGTHLLDARGHSGIWERFVPEAAKGSLYKYHIRSRHSGYQVDKSDPLSYFNEIPPKSASIVWDLDYDGADADWMHRRRQSNALDAPIAIYEMHVDRGNEWPMTSTDRSVIVSLRTAGRILTTYGFHPRGISSADGTPILRFMGLSNHRLFAPSGNYGTPQDLMYLIDTLHQAWNRCAAGLGAFALSARRAWAGLVRRHASL